MHAVHIERSGRASILRASGEVDAFVAPELDTAFAELSGTSRVVADLSRVTFLDSTALGAIVRGVRELNEVGTRVQVVLPEGVARRILEITALDRALPAAPSLRAALEALDD